MAINRNVSRLAQQRKGNVDFLLPEIPELPVGLAIRSPDMITWRNQFEEWRQNASVRLRDALSAIKTEV